jgi:hypothetical protein
MKKQAQNKVVKRKKKYLERLRLHLFFLFFGHVGHIELQRYNTVPDLLYQLSNLF